MTKLVHQQTEVDVCRMQQNVYYLSFPLSFFSASMSVCCSSLGGDVTRPGMAVMQNYGFCLMIFKLLWWHVRQLSGARRQLIYPLQKSVWGQCSVIASFWANHRNRGSGGVTQLALAAATAGLYCTPTCRVHWLMYFLGMQMGQWNIQQHLGKYCNLMCFQNRLLRLSLLKHVKNKIL